MKIMGTVSAKPIVGRYQSAHVLEICGRSFLIDCGEGTQTQLIAQKINIMRLDAVFISHIHGDHIYGLVPLLSTLGMLGRKSPLHIYGPANYAPFLKFFMSYNSEGFPFEPVFHPITGKEKQLIYENRSLTVHAFPLNHGIDTYGYLFSEKRPQMNLRKEAVEKYGFTRAEIGHLKAGEDIVRPAGPDEGCSFLNDFTRHSGTDEPLVIRNEDVAYLPFKPRSYAYASDTAPYPQLAGWVKGVDILYHEATFLKGLEDEAAKRHHSTTIQAAQCALEAGAGKLVIGHYSSRCHDIKVYENECRTVFPETYAAFEGDVFSI